MGAKKLNMQINFIFCYEILLVFLVYWMLWLVYD